MILLVYRQFFEKLTKRYSEVSKMWINNATAFETHTIGIPFGISKSYKLLNSYLMVVIYLM